MNIASYIDHTMLKPTAVEHDIIDLCEEAVKNSFAAVCEACVSAGADFVKTSTGFSDGGATEDDVDLMVKSVDGKCKVKAAGGVRTTQQAERMIEIGASRLGTSSGVAIISGEISKNSY